MVIVAFVLVLLAAASFAVGIAASRTSDTLVYLSIVFSLAAFLMLAIASFRARQAEREGSEGDWVPAPVPAPAATPTPRAAPTPTIDETQAHAGPLLGGLDPTQLDLTPSWRRSSRPRPEAAAALFLPEDEDEDFDEQLEDEEDEADFEVPVAPVVPAGVDDFRWGDLHDDGGLDALEVLEPEPELEPAPEPVPELQPELMVEGSFFDEYDDLTAAEILPFLAALDLEGLEWVRARERSGAKRATVVNQVEELIAEQGGRRSTASTRKRTTAKTTTKKKAAPAKRAAKKSTRRR